MLRFTDVNSAYLNLCANFPAESFVTNDDSPYGKIFYGRVNEDICCVPSQSRNGYVYRLYENHNQVFGMSFTHPWSRVLLNPTRNANPFFHLFESVWMFAGSNMVRPLTHFIKDFDKYSDNGTTLYGAYGYRWFNQLESVFQSLIRDPESRRCVVALYNSKDTGVATSDLPCNLSIAFDITKSPWKQDTDQPYLNMTVFNRSNDIIWGALGANYVHFTLLHQLMSELIGVPMGVYNQVSNNMHMYVKTMHLLDPSVCSYPKDAPKPTSNQKTLAYCLVPPSDLPEPESVISPSDPTRWPKPGSKSSNASWYYSAFTKMCQEFVSAVNLMYLHSTMDALPDTFRHGYCAYESYVDDFKQKVQVSNLGWVRSSFLHSVVLPMVLAHYYFTKKKDLTTAMTCLENVCCPDWRAAGTQWIQSRLKT